MRSRSSSVVSWFAIPVAVLMAVLNGVRWVLSAVLRWALLAGSYPSLGRDVGVDVWRVLHAPRYDGPRPSARRPLRTPAHGVCVHGAKPVAPRARLVA
jgi:hypothetical protein